jgi:tetratricopeptide (TPR) repeat protein
VCLATAYAAKQRTRDAVNALQRVTALRPKDADALTTLAAEYLSLVQADSLAVYNAQQASAVAVPSAAFQPPATTPFGKIFADPAGLKNPIDAALEQQNTTVGSAAYNKLLTDEQLTVQAYQNLAKLTPNDASAQLQLGRVAQQLNDKAVAIAAYEKFLKLAPTDFEAASVKKQLKTLKGTK